MLVIAQRLGRRIRLQLGNEIVWIKILDSQRHKVRLGFESNPKVRILREELLVIEEKGEPT